MVPLIKPSFPLGFDAGWLLGSGTTSHGGAAAATAAGAAGTAGAAGAAGVAADGERKET